MRNIAGKLLVITLAFSMITLNIASYVHCNSMVMNDDCCHVQNTVKSCCVKNLKVTFNEKLSSHCGCIVKEVPINTDLYIDLSNSLNKRIVNSDDQNSFNFTYEIHTNASYKYYSPPPKPGGTLFLELNNLRI